MTKEQYTVENVATERRQIEREVRAGQADVARAMGAWIASSVRRVLNAPTAVRSGRVVTA